MSTGHGSTHSSTPAHEGDYKSYKYQWTMSPFMSAVIAVVSIVSVQLFNYLVILWNWYQQNVFY